MALSVLVALASVLVAPQQTFKDEVTVHGFRLFATCWRTPTRPDPYLLWTIGSRDPAPEGQQWLIQGESIAFENLPIQPSAGFTKALTVSSPDEVAGPMIQQEVGEKAQVAVIRGRLERVERLTEELPLPELTVVKLSRNPVGDVGTMYHIQVDKPLKFTTPSGLRIEVPVQGANTKIRYAAMGMRPMAAMLVKPAFKDTTDSLPDSPLWKKYKGQVLLHVSLKGLQDPHAAGFVGRDYVVQSQGFGIKPGPLTGASLVITQTVVLQSYPLTFRVPVKEAKS